MSLRWWHQGGYGRSVAHNHRCHHTDWSGVYATWYGGGGWGGGGWDDDHDCDCDWW